jgi:hypothetical protein
VLAYVRESMPLETREETAEVKRMQDRQNSIKWLSEEQPPKEDMQKVLADQEQLEETSKEFGLSTEDYAQLLQAYIDGEPFTAGDGTEDTEDRRRVTANPLWCVARGGTRPIAPATV